MQFKKILSLFLLVFLLFLPFQSDEADAFSKGKPDPSAPPGTWYIGDSPSEKTGPPILFVHGLTGSASTWFEPNDMYQQARNAGHPTAYINLYPDKSNWENAAMLSEKLAEMHHFFGEKVVLVGHSKGGVDAQTALLHFNAEQYVSKVITLGTPHHGSQLANLAYSNWAGWLAGIIGMRSEGTDSLQTGTMAHFRAETDRLVTPQSVPFSTISGTSWGSFGSSLYFGGVYLQFYGTNDGAVTLDSSRLSYAPEIASLSLDHFDIAIGKHIFPLLRNELRHAKSVEIQEEQTSGQIVRGGEFSQTGAQSFLIENGVEEGAISVLASEKLDEAILISPSGKVQQAVINAEHEQSIFNGSYGHHFEIKSPEAGEWTIEMTHKNGASYLAIAALTGGVTSSIDTAQASIQPQLDTSEIDIANTTYTMHVNDKETVTDQPVQSASLYSAPIKPNTSQTITIDLSGKTTNGESFERTIVTNQYIDQNGNIFE